MENRKIIVTKDGSTTIQLADLNEQYHSLNGAIQEAKHVFIKNGLDRCNLSNISILEIGFGTGLNALITYLEAEIRKINIFYEGVEAFPIKIEEWSKMNYANQLQLAESNVIYEKIHSCNWEEIVSFGSYFTLIKRKEYFQNIKEKNKYNIIYFDAFSPAIQPELWTNIMFKNMFNALKNEGILVTYSAKGSVRRAMQGVGFKVSRLPGPPGKREMLFAVKN
ncbi:MAG: tRNA (5-methylaminomethyl-2-thiouridine)(34)-methyltransferase MnmD [Lutibacter sp.]